MKRARFNHLIRPVYLTLGALMLAALPGSAQASGGDCRSESGSVDVTLTRMRYKHTDGSWKYATGFGSHFSTAGINESNLREIYIAKVWQPPAADVRNVVIISAGQSAGSGVHNAITGQPEDYKWSSGTGMTRMRTIAGNSMAKKIMSRFDSSDTALMLVFDSGFEYQNLDAERTAVKNAFRGWVSSLAINPELIYYVGSSRGGALGLMVTAELTNVSAYPQLAGTNFIVQGVDPVFRYGEFGVSEHINKIQNPFETSSFATWKAQELDIRAQFGNDESRIRRVAAKVITTGDQVVLVAEGALPWGEWSNGSKRSGDNEPAVLHIYDGKGNTFYEGNWVYQAHTELGRNYCQGATESNNQVAFRDNNMLHHLDNALARFACHGRWTYSCDIRTGCPAPYFTCLCDAPYVSDGAGGCQLPCAVGEYYDPDADACVELCPSAQNLAFDPGTGSCVCAPGAHWSPEDGCVLCPDSDWDYYNQTCCPNQAPYYDGAYNECYADCGADAYWDFDPSSNLGHCQDYCDPCENPVWSTVCSAKDGRCFEVMSCVPQCEAGQVCGTTPGQFMYDVCVTMESTRR